MESVFIEIPRGVFQMDKNIIVGTVFRPPGTNLDKFHRRMEEIIIKILKENKKCYIMGDYNINLMNYDVHAATAEFTDVMYANSFVPLINRQTKITESSATLIDNILATIWMVWKMVFNAYWLQILVIILQLFTSMKKVKKNIQENEVMAIKGTHSSENRNLFHEGLSNMEWNSIYVNNDTQGAFTEFHDKLTTEYNRYFPKNEYTSNIMPKKPWISEGLRTKNRLYRKSIRIKTSYNESTYKMYRNNLKKILLKEQKNYYAKSLEYNKGNLKKTWAILKGIINPNKYKQTQSRLKLSDGQITADKQIISEKFNDFFVSIGPNLAHKIPNQTQSPLSYQGNRLSNTIFLEPVSEEEVYSIVISLKNSAPGYDEVTASILKYKADDDMLFNNYRPVSFCVIKCLWTNYV